MAKHWTLHKRAERHLDDASRLLTQAAANARYAVDYSNSAAGLHEAELERHAAALQVARERTTEAEGLLTSLAALPQ